MLDQVLTSMPLPATGAVALASAAGAIAGGILWLCGSRFSRSLVTLLAVTAGGWVGLKCPAWFNIPIGAWATATGGALALGLLGYSMHRWWVSTGLVVLLVGWVAVASYAAYGLVVCFPAWPEDMSPVDYAQQLWFSMPAGLQHLFPVACAMALAGGITVACRWVRITAYLFYSLLGASMLLVLGVVAMKLGRPTMLGMIPAGNSAQVLLLAGMALFGALVQWRMAPRSSSPSPSPKTKEE